MKTVQVPLNERTVFDGIGEIECPYCDEPRQVEPDAYYVVECEGCGKEYKVLPCI